MSVAARDPFPCACQLCARQECKKFAGYLGKPTFCVVLCQGDLLWLPMQDQACVHGAFPRTCWYNPQCSAVLSTSVYAASWPFKRSFDHTSNERRPCHPEHVRYCGLSDTRAAIAASMCVPWHRPPECSRGSCSLPETKLSTERETAGNRSDSRLHSSRYRLWAQCSVDLWVDTSATGLRGGASNTDDPSPGKFRCCWAFR